MSSLQLEDMSVFKFSIGGSTVFKFKSIVRAATRYINDNPNSISAVSLQCPQPGGYRWCPSQSDGPAP